MKEYFMTENEYYTQMGEKYGYPPCCIASFISNPTRLLDVTHVTYGTGYVPCDRCAEIIKDFSKAQVVQWRKDLK
jgi:hypothetical protein